ncbi:MAG: glycosyltransferase family 4 protein [Chitinophagaceae bacterium]|nr:glycosyltransferase family 4 protein [Chitinophagaceae bacterium]
MGLKKEAVVIFSPGFAANEEDTTCLPAQQVFFEELQKQLSPVEVIIFSFQYPYSSNEYFFKDIRVIPFNGRTRGGIFHLVLWLRVWMKFRKIKKQYRVKTVLSLWCCECALVGKFLCRIYKLDFFCWILGQDAKADNHYVKKIRPAAKELIAMSEFLVNEFEKNHKIKPANIIENSIDARLFYKGDKEKLVDIFCAGSLIPLKQYDIAIEIIGDILKDFPMIRVVICGKGPEEQKLRQLINDKSLAAHVHLIGEQAHHQVLRLMESSKIFLHPSAYEGFSSACLEALQAGMHVVSFWQPMSQPIKHWHIVHTKKEMKDKIVSLLTWEQLDHSPVMVFDVKVKAKQMKELLLQ